MNRSFALVVILLAPAAANRAAGDPCDADNFDTPIFREDFNGPNGNPPDPNVWVIGHPEDCSGWRVQGRTFFPDPNHHPAAPFPRLDANACVITHAWREAPGTIVVLDPASGNRRKFETGFCTDFAISPDGDMLAAILKNGFVCAWRLSDGNELYGQEEAEKAIREAKAQVGWPIAAAYYYELDISPDGKVLVTSSGGFARLGAHAPVFRDAETGELIDRGGETWRIMRVRYLDAGRIEAQLLAGTLRTWDANSGGMLSAEKHASCLLFPERVCPRRKPGPRNPLNRDYSPTRRWRRRSVG
jgi:hypothetical protein